MSEEENQTFSDWLKTRQNECYENKIRAQAYFDQPPQNGLWSWLRDAFNELTAIYGIIEQMHSNRLSDFKFILGLDETASNEEIQMRAKILGNLLQKIIDDAKEIEEEERHLLSKTINKEKSKE